MVAALRRLNRTTGGRRILGTPYVGLLASQIVAETATGDAGPGLLYDDALANPGTRLRLKITSLPSTGTLFVYENGAFNLDGVTESTTIGYDVYVDNVYLKSDVATVTFGTTGSISAGGSDTVSGSANLAAQVALAGIGVSVVGGTAGAAVAVPLSAAGIAISSGTSNESAAVTISAAALAEAAGQAGLSPSVLLAAAGAAQSSGNSALAAQLQLMASGAGQASGSANLSAQSGGQISASGGDVASGAAVLSVTVRLQAAGSDVVSGSATGSVTSPGQLAAIGAGQADGTAQWATLVNVTAAGFVQAMAAGAFSVDFPLAADGTVRAAGQARLSLQGASRYFTIDSDVYPVGSLLATPHLVTSIKTGVYRV